MRSRVLQLMLLIALVFQGVVAVGGEMSPDHGQQQHCAGHDLSKQDCACCPDGAAGMNGCTVQCSVSQAPMVMLAPIRVASYSANAAFVQLDISNPGYAPLVPPPIA